MTETATAGWTDHFIDVAGHRIQVSRAGSGEPLVIMPDDIGVPGWLPFHDELARSRSLYLVTHPGFGKSDRPGWARSVRDLIGLETALLRELGLPAPDVLGFGFGGWLAAEMATLCGRRFRRLALVAPFGLKPAEGEIYDQFLGRGPAYARAGFADETLFESVYGSEPDLDTLEGWEVNREMTARVAWAPYLFNPALPHLLPLVEAPTLIAWGADDAIIPASEAPRWASLLPRARTCVIPGCGHRADIEQPRALAGAVLSFLEDEDDL